jgi:hydroxymethylpyrimidine/phosphomethylpyrimidine kinase
VPFAAARLNTRNVHGTGCTLSSAIAAGLAKGESLENAVRQAKDYITAAIAAADQLGIDRDNGPIHHFHAYD